MLMVMLIQGNLARYSSFFCARALKVWQLSRPLRILWSVKVHPRHVAGLVFPNNLMADYGRDDVKFPARNVKIAKVARPLTAIDNVL
jgi:hypothetical protein